MAVAGKTVEPVQRQMFLKARKPHELFQRRRAHFLDRSELHVIVHQRKDLLGVLIREAQSFANGLGHAHTDLHMMVETNAVPRFRRGLECRWLADVVK